MLPCYPALTLRGLLSTRDNMLELNGVSSPGHFSLILTPSYFLWLYAVCPSIFIFHPSQLSPCPSATLHPPYSSSILTFPSISPPSLCHPVITTRAVPSPALAWAHTHQAFLMLLHSAAAAAAAVSSFPLSPLWLCLLLLSPGVVSLPSAPSEAVSHRDYNLISGDLEIFLSGDVRHVK